MVVTRRATFRLYPTSAQVRQLHEWRKMHQYLYNAAVANRRTQYERFERSVGYMEQQNCLPAFKQVWHASSADGTALRSLAPKYKALGSQALQATLKRVDVAYQRFFNKILEEGNGVFVEVPTKQVKPSQTCPKCSHQHKKKRDERVHCCSKCGYVQDRDLAAAEVMVLWALGKLPESGTGFANVDGSSSTVKTKVRKNCGAMQQLGQRKRSKPQPADGDVETPSSQSRAG